MSSADENQRRKSCWQFRPGTKDRVNTKIDILGMPEPLNLETTSNQQSANPIVTCGSTYHCGSNNAVYCLIAYDGAALCCRK
jgi:hypothetical protein